MSKKLKLYIIGLISLLMVASWAFIFFSGSVGQSSNNIWQAAMGFTALLFGVIGMFTSKQWGWFKSSVGRAVFFLSLGLLFWGMGQSYWTYFLFADSGSEVPQSYLMDIILISVIPIWIYGILSLAKATGSKYGFRDAGGTAIGILLVVFMSLFSYFTLVIIARDGVLFSEDQSTWQSVFDIAYPLGDTILLTLSILIFVYSWNYLGGRFKKQILLILAAFVMLFIADLSFSYTDGIGSYYNGNLVDLFFILMVILFGLGVSLLDPRSTWKKQSVSKSPTPTSTDSNLQAEAIEPANITSTEAVMPANEQPDIKSETTIEDKTENIKSDSSSQQDDESLKPHDAEFLHEPHPEYQQERPN